MNAASHTTHAQLVPFALKDTPALIEAVFPAQKISFEAQRERKAGAGQTLTALGSYWKGRKPLILVRAIVLGGLLPQTGDRSGDLELFERLLAIDEDGLVRRVYENDGLKPKDIATRISLVDPWRYFSHDVKASDARFERVEKSTFPIRREDFDISIRWRKDTSQEEKLRLLKMALATFPSYEERSELGKRPEEIDQEWLYAPVWPKVNEYFSTLELNVNSIHDLVEQIGILRYGHRPRVGDTFCGGGSIPFEAARLGCDVYASDLNPIACMLTWGAINILGGTKEVREEIVTAQTRVARAVDEEITALRIEHDDQGNRAKVYLYCAEVRCPQTGWRVPLAPSWVISMQRNVIAKLSPNYSNQRFDIEIVTGVSATEMKKAGSGTLQNGSLVYELDSKIYRTPIKTLRGDYRDASGDTRNRLRLWDKLDFKPQPHDVFQERLYAIQWITRESLDAGRQETYFAAITEEDLSRDHQVEAIVTNGLAVWQAEGLVPNMEIEPGYNTDQPIRERGWTHWHHLFNPRQLLIFCLYRRHARIGVRSDLYPSVLAIQSKSLEWNTRLCRWATSTRHENQVNTFSNQALNTLYNYAARALPNLENHSVVHLDERAPSLSCTAQVFSSPANRVCFGADLFVTDPPYADAVHYHEITEFFIAWLRGKPPRPFDEWVWDSRRALAIKGAGDDFRREMVAAYLAMSEHMPNNGMQCVMFTHQDTGVWADMVGIFWAAGLQVAAAWYIATETTSELKKGGYVQGTVILILKKRPPGEKAGFKQRILPEVRAEVEKQIQSMMHLNNEIRVKHGEPAFNDSDLQMGGYAAALKVLTEYTHIGGEDVTTFSLRPRQKDEPTVVDEIVQQAAEAANSLLVPEDLNGETWAKLNGIQRFYLRMMDMETTGASKLDNYQNFAKAFRVQEYVRVMGDITANQARLKRITEFASRDLTDSTEIGGTVLGNLIIAIQQLLKDVEPQAVISQVQAEMPDFIELRPLMIDISSFIERKSPEQNVRSAAEVFGARLRNLRAIGQ
jgi:adenine-specific DNA methylase